MCLPRRVNALRFSSAFGVLCAIYLGIAITLIFWFDKDLVKDPIANLKEAELFKVRATVEVYVCLDLFFRCVQHPSTYHFRLHVPVQHAHDLQRT